MHKRRIATLVTAAFAGLMLSSPSFAADVIKSQNPSGTSMAPPATSGSSTPVPVTGRQSSVEERGAASKEVVAVADADYNSAVEKCDAQPTSGRSSCMADATAAHSLAMSNGRNGPPATK